MSLGIRVWGEDFGSRLCASLGAEEAFRAEQWLCATRIVLASYCYTWTHVVPAQMAPQLWRVQVLLNSYLLFSIILFIILRLYGASDLSYRLASQAADLFFAAALTISTGGSESAYGALWVFVVVSSAVRWGMRETTLTAAGCAVLMIIEATVYQLWPEYFKVVTTGDFTTDQLLVRAAFLIVSSVFLGHLVVREKWVRAESALIARVLGGALAESRLDLALEGLFEEIAELYLPRKSVLALRKGNAEEVFSRERDQPVSKTPSGTVKTVLQFSKLEAAAFSLSAHTWYFDRDLWREGGSSGALAFDSSGRSVDFLDSEDLLACFPASELPPLLVTSFSFGEALSGRLILVSPSLRAGGKEGLRFLQSLVKQISPVVQNIYVLRDMRMQMEDQVRAQLARELHDGTLQSLLSAEMQIEVLKRPDLTLPSDLHLRLETVQALIRQEALNLRDLIENTKPLSFGPQQLPDFLAEIVARFRRETGISVRLETGEENFAFAQTTCHEIVRIVQEGLSNVRKHSGASNVVIRLSKGDEGQQKLLIFDDGLGFGFRGRVTQTQLDAAHRGPGVIKERVRLIGGELTIDSTPGQGARLEITIPKYSNG